MSASPSQKTSFDLIVSLLELHRPWRSRSQSMILFFSQGMRENAGYGSLSWQPGIMTRGEGRSCSEIIPWLVLRLRGSEVVLQKGLQVLEGGPLLGVLLPALHHQLVERRGAVLRARHSVAPLDLLQHLPVVHACKWEH